MVHGDFHDWWAERSRANRFEVTGIPFSELVGWRFTPETGNLAHDSGHFFSVEGLRVDVDGKRTWSQPVLNQPEIGILGILIRDFDGVPHGLMQAKMEPGNCNTLQLSPTVQATRSNYTRVHGGSDTRYLEYFRSPRRGETLVDALHSEQGAWFWHKRNRNMVVKVTGPVPEHEDYRWIPLRQVRRLLHVDNLVNMDTRSVLACLPPDPAERSDGGSDGDTFAAALARSYDADAPSRHTMAEVLSWFTEAKTRCEWTARPVPLAGIPRWSRSDYDIGDDDGERFQIVAVRVRADNREVSGWTQPLLAPRRQGFAAFLTRPFDGVLHVLMCARPEPGLPEMVEFGPTVQLPSPGNGNPVGTELYGMCTDGLRFDSVLSEEGGRFHHARTRYQIVYAGDELAADVPMDFIWLTVHQIMRLLQHGRYLNVEARSLLACLHSLW